jgi:hypothetical protein
MTEAELWHMALLATEDLQAILETLLTVLSAYLAAAYFVGKKLTRFQAALVSSLFVAAAGVAGFMSVVMWRRTVYFLDQLVDRFGVESHHAGTICSGLRRLHVSDSQTSATRSGTRVMSIAGH